MAVYSKEHKLLFIGNKRTGSTAIGQALVEQFGAVYLPREVLKIDGEKISKRHCTIKQISRHNLIDIPLSKLYKFTAVRNPFDSIVSKYVKRRFREKHRNSICQKQKMTFEQWVYHHFKSDRPQSMHEEYVKGTDKIIYFERLQEGLTEVLNEVSAPPILLPVVNKTEEKSMHYCEYYNEETRKIISRIFAQDLENFDYSFETPFE